MPATFHDRCAEMLRTLDLFRAELVGYLAAEPEVVVVEDEAAGDPRSNSSWWPDAIEAALIAANGPLTTRAVGDAVHALGYPGLEDAIVRRKRASTYLSRNNGKLVHQVEGGWDLIRRPAPSPVVAVEAVTPVDEEAAAVVAPPKRNFAAEHRAAALKEAAEKAARIAAMTPEEKQAIADAAAAAARLKEEKEAADQRARDIQAKLAAEDRRKALAVKWDALFNRLQDLRYEGEDCTDVLHELLQLHPALHVPEGPRLIASIDLPPGVTFETESNKPDCAVESDPASRPTPEMELVHHPDYHRMYPFVYSTAPVPGETPSRDDRVRRLLWAEGVAAARFSPAWSEEDKAAYLETGKYPDQSAKQAARTQRRLKAAKARAVEAV